MKCFIGKLLFLICCLSASYLSAVNDDIGSQAKLYFAQSELEIDGSIMRIHLDNYLVEINALRSDQQGLFILDCDITSCHNVAAKEWKCPYCYHWWPIGEKC